MNILKVIGLGAFSLFLHAANAQESDQQPAVNAEREMERIEVRGRKPRLFYLSEYRKHQTDFVNMFNELVDDSEMEVICELDSSTGSRIRKRTCQPRFMKTIVGEETQRELSRGSSFQEAGNVDQRQETQKRLIQEYKVFQKLTAELLNKHSDLASSYVKMDEALAKYEEYNKD